MDPLSLFLLFSFQLFLIVDPVAVVPIFISITKGNTKEERKRMAMTSIKVASIVLIAFLFFGGIALNYFSISMEAIKIGGGILIFFIGLEMIYGKYTGSELTESEKVIARDMDDISVTPLAIPLLAGPGAITTVLLFANQSQYFVDYFLMALGIIVVGILSYFIISRSDRILKLLGEIGTKVIIRVMGLFLVFLSVQSVINGVVALL